MYMHVVTVQLNVTIQSLMSVCMSLCMCHAGGENTWHSNLSLPSSNLFRQLSSVSPAAGDRMQLVEQDSSQAEQEY